MKRTQVLETGDYIVGYMLADADSMLFEKLIKARKTAYMKKLWVSAGQDSYDDYYTHLYVYHKSLDQVVAACRVVDINQVVAHKGFDGLFTSTVFKYNATLVEKIGKLVEMGRVFVSQDYQNGD